LNENNLKRHKNHTIQKMRKMEIEDVLFFRADRGGRKTDHRRNEDNKGKGCVTDSKGLQKYSKKLLQHAKECPVTESFRYSSNINRKADDATTVLIVVTGSYYDVNPLVVVAAAATATVVMAAAAAAAVAAAVVAAMVAAAVVAAAMVAAAVVAAAVAAAVVAAAVVAAAVVAAVMVGVGGVAVVGWLWRQRQSRWRRQ
jgi:uncharacterized membrane protein YeiB